MTEAGKRYRELLRTDFWKELSTEKKRLVPACEECGAANRLHAHHKVYPKWWEDTTLDMLEVLCHWCHGVRHGMTEDTGGTDHFTPLFSNVVDSTLWTESDLVVKVFLTMLAKMGRDYIVKANSFNLARWANKTEAEVLSALDVLSSPDTKRAEPQEYEGRRVEKVPDGWMILNGKKHHDRMRLMFKRAKKKSARGRF